MVETDKNERACVKGKSAGGTSQVFLESGCARVLAQPCCLLCMCPIFRPVSPDGHGKAATSKVAAWSPVHSRGEELLGTSPGIA